MKKCKKVAGVILAAGIAATTVALGSGTVHAATPGYKTVKTSSGNKIQYIGKDGKPYVGFHYMTKAEGVKTPHFEFFDKKGYMATNWRRLTKADGEKIEHFSYFGNNGWLRTGWQKMGTKENPDGKNKEHMSYFGSNGWLQTGWKKFTKADGESKEFFSYFGSNGWMQTGWKRFTKADGEKITHFSYFGKDGKLRTGWQYLTEEDGEKTPHWSYFGDNGWLVTGKKKIDGTTYTFNSSGWLTSGDPNIDKLPDGCYTISPISNSKVLLDVKGASTAAGTVIQTYPSNGSVAQKFQIKHFGDGIYSIRTGITIYKSGLAVNGSVAAGTSVVQKNYSGVRTQKWKIVSLGKGIYTFKTLDGKYVLDMASGTAKLAKSTGSTSQRFKLTKTSGYLVRNNRKYFFNANGQAPMIGVDVSKWNDDIDWKAVKNDGIGFAIIRTSYSSDSKYEWKTVDNIKGCEANGIPYGVYFYSIATTNAEADKEVALVKKILGKYKPKLGVYIDIEDTNIYSKAFGNIYSSSARRKITDLTKRMAKNLKAAGYKVGVYANANYMNEVLYKKELPDILWGAYYYTNPNSNTKGLTEPNTDWNLWQYSETGTVKGIKGKVDMNTLIKKYW